MLSASSLDPEWIVSSSRSAISTPFLAFGTPQQFYDLIPGQGIDLRMPIFPVWERGYVQANSPGWGESASFPALGECLVERREVCANPRRPGFNPQVHLHFCYVSLNEFLPLTLSFFFGKMNVMTHPLYFC